MMVLTRFLLLVYPLEGSCFDLVQVNEFWCLNSSILSELDELGDSKNSFAAIEVHSEK